MATRTGWGTTVGEHFCQADTDSTHVYYGSALINWACGKPARFCENMGFSGLLWLCSEHYDRLHKKK